MKNGIFKFQVGGKVEKIKTIQQSIGVPVTGKWDSNTDKVYRQKMQETGLSNVDLANQIVNKLVNNETPVIESFGKYKQCTAEGCAAFVTTKGSELLKIDRDKYSKETGSEGSDAWTRKPYLIDKGGIELNVNDYSKINVGDVIGLDRPSYGSSVDSNWNKSRDKKAFPRTTENVHVGIVVGKTKDGVPVVEHYSAAKKMSYREPINNMKELGSYTTKWAVRPNINQKQQTVVENKPKLDDRRLNIQSENPIRKEYVKSINDNLPKFAEISGLNQDELLGLGKIAAGILERESESGNTNTPLNLKEALANTAYTLGLKSTPASQGLTQIKPTAFQNQDGTYTFAGKYKPYFNINDLNNPKDAANATMLNLIQNYKTIKTKYPNMTEEQLWSAVARSHQGLNQRGLGNVLSYEDEYSNKAIMDSKDVTYEGDKVPTIEKIRSLREALKQKPANYVALPNKSLSTQFSESLAPKYKKGGLFVFKTGGKLNQGSKPMEFVLSKNNTITDHTLDGYKLINDKLSRDNKMSVKGYLKPLNETKNTTQLGKNLYTKLSVSDIERLKKGGYLKDKNTYVTKDGKETRRGLWANVYLKKKNK